MVDRPPQPADDDNTKAHQRRRLVLPPDVVGPLVLGLLVVVVLLLACVFWIPKWMYPSLTDNDLKDVQTTQNELDTAKVQELKDARLKLQNDARTTLLQGLGALLLLTGAGIGAYVTLRQVRVSQDGLHATREQMQHTLETTRQQLNLTEQGQVTDRYTRAVEQLGHGKAPVRLGALYSLEHLAQDNPQYHQTVVAVVCAYLRMPYTLPAQPELDAEDVKETALPASDRDRTSPSAPDLGPAREELQVRRTAQRLLANHLRRPPQTSGQDAQLLEPSPQQGFWPGISIDLTGSTLVDFDFEEVSLKHAQFGRATFHGDARFTRATFHGDARFGKATFHGDAEFGKATFHGDAEFGDATIQGLAWFGDATFRGDTRFDDATIQGNAQFGGTIFHGDAGFGGATFHGDTWFAKATFHGDTRFGGATFHGDAGFSWATFHGDAGFLQATFQDIAGFREATFRGDAGFGGARFRGDAWFGGATFQGDARFRGATFQGEAGFTGTHVLQVDRYSHRMWPNGWTVRPDPTDPSHGTLFRAEHTNEPESAAPPPDTLDSG